MTHCLIDSSDEVCQWAQGAGGHAADGIGSDNSDEVGRRRLRLLRLQVPRWRPRSRRHLRRVCAGRQQGAGGHAAGAARRVHSE